MIQKLVFSGSGVRVIWDQLFMKDSNLFYRHLLSNSLFHSKLIFIDDSFLFHRQRKTRRRFENISSSTESLNWQTLQKCAQVSFYLFIILGQTFIFSLFRKVLKYHSEFRFDLSWSVIIYYNFWMNVLATFCI